MIHHRKKPTKSPLRENVRPPEAFFQEQDQTLLTKLREKLKRQETAKVLAEASGVADVELLEQLAGLGITADNLQALHLVPLLEVAWADGEIQADEAELIRAAAEEAKLSEGATAFLEQLLVERPDAAFFDSAARFVRLVLSALPDSEAAHATDSLWDLAYRVADASGGIFGLFRRVEASERVALKHLAERLGAGHASATADLMERL